MTGTTYGIVAGYDGSPGAAQALRWAAREACARGTTLTVCLAWTPDHMDLPTESALCDLARQHGQEILTRGLPYAESVLGPGRVHPDLAAGSAAQALRERGVRVHYFGQLLGETLELPEGRAFVLDRLCTPEMLGPNLIAPLRRDEQQFEDRAERIGPARDGGVLFFDTCSF